MKQLIRNNIKLFIGILIGGILFSGITYVVATGLTSGDIDYTGNGQTTVESALNDLYNKAHKFININDLVTMDNKIGNGYLYYHSSGLTNGAGDSGYRYAGENPNNYVCFGSSAQTCPTTNLYRIIGLIPVDVVVDETTNPITIEKQFLFKIIKYDYMTSSEISNCVGTYNGGPIQTSGVPSGNQYVSNPQGYYWSGSTSNHNNTWSSSTLNTLELNGTYLNNLGIWSSKIAKVIWKVGGRNTAHVSDVTPISSAYTNEILNSGLNVTVAPTDGKNEYAAKVGLMYATDYGYAAPQSYWNTIMYNYSNAKGSNWLYRGVTEWNITRVANNSECIYNINADGNLYSGGYVYSFALGLRPTIYLNKTTLIDFENHDGTKTDPYRIN